MHEVWKILNFQKSNPYRIFRIQLDPQNKIFIPFFSNLCSGPKKYRYKESSFFFFIWWKVILSQIKISENFNQFLNVIFHSAFVKNDTSFFESFYIRQNRGDKVNQFIKLFFFQLKFLIFWRVFLFLRYSIKISEQKLRKNFRLPLCKVHSNWKICDSVSKFCIFGTFWDSKSVSQNFWDFSCKTIWESLNLFWSFKTRFLEKPISQLILLSSKKL